MKPSELLRLVSVNLIQNKFKVILTSVGVIVGAATIVMVIAIGRGGQMDVADQFKNINAGAIDITYERATTTQSGRPSASGSSSRSSGSGQQQFGAMPGGQSGQQQFGAMPGGQSNQQSGNMPQGGDFFGGIFGGSQNDSRINREQIVLDEEDAETLETFVPGISSVTVSGSTKVDVEGGDLEEATSYTVAGVKENYFDMSNLSMAMGEFLSDEEDAAKDKVCVLGATAAKEIFGNAYDAYDSILYIDGRSYVVNGVLESMGQVSSGISPDEAVFIPYNTAKKYILGNNTSATITVIAQDVNEIDAVLANVKTVLTESYPNAEFTYADAGSKMEAASASNNTLTLLLFAMAAIVFIVGGIGIMNVLFVSVKERTNEIGILKAIGCEKKSVLLEFLLEACCISVVGGILGVGVALALTPLVEMFGVRVELSVSAGLLAICFAVFTGTVFGFYPAYKASKLTPVDALNFE